MHSQKVRFLPTIQKIEFNLVTEGFALWEDNDHHHGSTSSYEGLMCFPAFWGVGPFKNSFFYAYYFYMQLFKSKIVPSLTKKFHLMSNNHRLKQTAKLEQLLKQC